MWGSGGWRVGSGEWRVAGDEWRVAGGEWGKTIDNQQLTSCTAMTVEWRKGENQDGMELRT